MEATNGKDILSCIKEVVPKQATGFNLDYIQAAKVLDMQNTACNPDVIKAAHVLYPLMLRTPFNIADFLYAIKTAGTQESIELMTSKATVDLLVNKLEEIKETANNGHRIQNKENAMFIGFAWGIGSKIDVEKEGNLGVIRK